MPASIILNKAFSFNIPDFYFGPEITVDHRFFEEGHHLAPTFFCVSKQLSNSMTPLIMTGNNDNSNKEDGDSTSAPSSSSSSRHRLISTRLFHFIVSFEKIIQTFLPFINTLSLYAKDIHGDLNYIRQKVLLKRSPRYFLQFVSLRSETSISDATKQGRKTARINEVKAWGDFLINNNPVFEACQFHPIDRTWLYLGFHLLEFHPSETVRVGICKQLRTIGVGPTLAEFKSVYDSKVGKLKSDLIDMLCDSILGRHPIGRVSSFETACEYLCLLSTLFVSAVSRDQNEESDDYDDNWGRAIQDSFDSLDIKYTEKIFKVAQVFEHILMKETSSSTNSKNLIPLRLEKTLTHMPRPDQADAEDIMRSATQSNLSISAAPETLFLSSLIRFIKEITGRASFYAAFLMSPTSVLLSFDSNETTASTTTDSKNLPSGLSRLFHVIFSYTQFYTFNSHTYNSISGPLTSLVTTILHPSRNYDMGSEKCRTFLRQKGINLAEVETTKMKVATRYLLVQHEILDRFMTACVNFSAHRNKIGSSYFEKDFNKASDLFYSIFCGLSSLEEEEHRTSALKGKEDSIDFEKIIREQFLQNKPVNDPENAGMSLVKSMVSSIKIGFPKRGESQEWSSNAAALAEKSVMNFTTVLKLLLRGRKKSESTTEIKQFVNTLIFDDEKLKIFEVIAAAFPNPSFHMSSQTKRLLVDLANTLVNFFDVESEKKLVRDTLEKAVQRFGEGFPRADLTF